MKKTALLISLFLFASVSYANTTETVTDDDGGYIKTEYNNAGDVVKTTIHEPNYETTVTGPKGNIISQDIKN